jgi:hypothetical protein
LRRGGERREVVARGGVKRFSDEKGHGSIEVEEISRVVVVAGQTEGTY